MRGVALLGWEAPPSPDVGRGECGAASSAHCSDDEASHGSAAHDADRRDLEPLSVLATVPERSSLSEADCRLVDDLPGSLFPLGLSDGAEVAPGLALPEPPCRYLVTVSADAVAQVERGDDAVGSPHRAQISQFELFELILLLKSDKRFLVEQCEATVSQSTAPSPPLSRCARTSRPASPTCRAARTPAPRRTPLESVPGCDIHIHVHAQDSL